VFTAKYNPYLKTQTVYHAITLKCKSTFSETSECAWAYLACPICTPMVVTDILVKHPAFNFRLEATYTPKMHAAGSCETTVTTCKITECRNTGDYNL